MGIGAEWIGGEACASALGDNIIYGHGLVESVKAAATARRQRLWDQAFAGGGGADSRHAGSPAASCDRGSNQQRELPAEG